MMASSSSYRQPAYALRRRRRNAMMRLVTPFLSIIAILLLSSPSSSPSSSFSLSPFSFAFGASSLQYPCLVCEHFLHTYLQNYLLDRSLNANLRPEESITVTTLPTPEEFCTSAAFQRLTHLHIYLDETDRKEIERLEGQSLKSGRQPVSPRFAEFGLDDMTDEEYHADQRQNHPAHIEMRAHIQAEREEQQQHEREAMESNRPEESTSTTHEHEMDPLAMIEVEQDLEMGEYDDDEQLMLSFQHVDDDLTLDEKLLHDDALSDSTLGDALTESDVFIELSLELGAPPSQAEVAKKLAALKEEERLAAERRIPLKPLPANVPLTSIEYYAHKSRPVCMVYEDGVCKLFDSSASLTPEIHTLPNPFSRAFIQHKPALLKQVTDRIRARKRRQALHMLSVGDKKRIERVERELLRKSALDATVANPFAPKSKSSKPPLPPRYRKYESCLKIVTRLRTSSQQIQEIVRDGCTYQNRTALRAIPPSPPPPPVTTAKALYQQQPKDPYEEMRRKLMLGEYAWPCPLRAACNGLLQPDGQPYCPTKSMDTRLQPVDLQFLSRGFKGGSLPAEVTKMNSFTPIQQATMASLRNGALPPTTKGFKVQSGGVASSTSKQFKHAQKPIRQQRTQAAKGEVRAKTPLDNIDAEAKRLDNKVSQFRDA